MFTRSEALAVGVPGSTIDRWIRSGRWRRAGRGVIVVAGTPSTWQQRAAIAVL
ncbi:MAG: type IV toxin-antitoxin system AbiEi family antitoxin domain-containing protein [Acidimicrobiia bacterium]|nr:type IV toxin-antitoxin system AbiEi family antitoxin domain-containing protein [Acidimicrobiia bacterium]